MSTRVLIYTRVCAQASYLPPALRWLLDGYLGQVCVGGCRLYESEGVQGTHECSRNGHFYRYRYGGGGAGSFLPFDGGLNMKNGVSGPR